MGLFLLIHSPSMQPWSSQMKTFLAHQAWKRLTEYADIDMLFHICFVQFYKKRASDARH